MLQGEDVGEAIFIQQMTTVAGHPTGKFAIVKILAVEDNRFILVPTTISVLDNVLLCH
jgi:hypothetical protein